MGKIRVGFVSLGCAKNRVDSERMMWLVRQAGYEVTGETDAVDVVVVNTCGFIRSAKEEAIATILKLGEAKRRGRIGRIVVAGCLAERYRESMLRELPEIDAAVGVGALADIALAVGSAVAGEPFSRFVDVNVPEPEAGRVLTTAPAWAYLKIADGCDNRCAYCAIPDIRGRYRSRTVESLLDEAGELAGRGVREIILVAQDTTRYGADIYGRPRLTELLVRLCEIRDLEWIRLHYLYPDGIDDELVDVIAGHDKILKYLDIPIQHISDSVLSRMRRRGTGAQIRELLRKVRERLPGVVLRTSLIAGLPGEGEREFEEFCDFLREYKIERAGVFKYSPEEGTPAAYMVRPDGRTASRRAEAIMAIQKKVMDDFNLSRVGSVVTVLSEGQEGGRHFGRSYAESPEIDGVVRFEGRGVRPGSFCRVRITGVSGGEVVGAAVE